MDANKEANNSGSTNGPVPEHQNEQISKENELLRAQNAYLWAVNRHLQTKIAENERILSIQMQALCNLPHPPPQQLPLQNQANLSRRGGDRRSQKPDCRKTVICKAWLESRSCPYAENCSFAHGEEELRRSWIDPRPNKLYRTKVCEKFTTTGICQYGERCFFIHPNQEASYIREDRIFEVSQRHAFADLRDSMGECSSASPALSTVPQPPTSNDMDQLQTKWTTVAAQSLCSENAPPKEEVTTKMFDFDELAEDMVKILDL